MLMAAPATLTVVDGNPVVGRALAVLLERAGYEVRSLAHPFDGHPGEVLEETELLLLPPTLGREAREGLVNNLKGVPALARLPVVALMAAGDEAPLQDGVAAYVSWPSRIEALVEHIEAALGFGPHR